MTYDKKFIDLCLELFSKIKQNRSIQECLNINAQLLASAPAQATTDPNEQIWFIYYMFFAIHNPKMEDYIQKKTGQRNIPDIIKNMIKRRHYTSTIVFQLYTHAYTNQGNVSYIYPKDKDNIARQLIKSYQANHLKTTAVLLRRAATASAATAAATAEFIEYIMSTQPITSTIATASATAVLDKVNNHINYARKDIILLALACYMKIDEEDINKKNIFIAVTPEEINGTTTPATETHEPPSPYDKKYKYLYS
jgi:hypothetical protein